MYKYVYSIYILSYHYTVALYCMSWPAAAPVDQGSYTEDGSAHSGHSSTNLSPLNSRKMAGLEKERKAILLEINARSLCRYCLG